MRRGHAKHGRPALKQTVADTKKRAGLARALLARKRRTSYPRKGAAFPRT